MRRSVLLCLLGLIVATWGLRGAAARADDAGELFPGVKGVSGEELQRQVEEYDRTHHTTPVETPQYTPPPPPPPPPPHVTPPTPKPVVVASSATAPASAIAALPGPSTKTAPPSSNTKVVARASYLAKLSDQADYVEAYLKKAKVIRDQTREEANQGNDSEAFNQYVLRYDGADLDAGRMQAPHAVRYFKTMMLPATIYRYIYSLADTCADRAKKVAAADDVTPEDKTAAEAMFKRLRVVRKFALLGSAEVFCLIRHMEAAGHNYDQLLREYPGDAEIKASYDHYVSILNQPRPIHPPHGPGE
jgi:hypothetical protein